MEKPRNQIVRNSELSCMLIRFSAYLLGRVYLVLALLKVDASIQEVGSWVLITKEFKDLSHSMLMRDWKTAISLNAPRNSVVPLDWLPPSESLLKLNFDGSSKGNTGPSGFGCMIRFCTSNIV